MDLFSHTHLPTNKLSEKKIASIQAFLDEGKEFMISFTIGKSITLYGNPTVMMAYSDLFLQFSDSLSSLKTDPPHLSATIEIDDDTLPGLLRVWLYLNGILAKPIDLNIDYLKSTLTANQLLQVWHWMNYFGIDLASEVTRDYIYLVIQRIKNIRIEEKINKLIVIMSNLERGKDDTYLDEHQVRRLNLILQSFDRIKVLCSQQCKGDCGMDLC